MEDAAAYDIALLRRARQALRDGDERTAREAAGELWLRYEHVARAASRRQARGVEAEEVLGAIQVRFVRFVYDRELEPDSMNGLIHKMATFAYGDVQRVEAREAPTVEDIGDWGADDGDVATLHDRDALTRLFAVLNDRERLVMERDLDDVPDEEIAAELDVKTNNLHQIRFRAMRKLREAAEAGAL